VTTFIGSLRGEGRRFGIVASRFNETITQRLVEGAVGALRKYGVAVDQTDVVWVPGAFEIAFAARRLAASGGYDAVICLGAVIRGETAHFELVAGEAARGIADVSRDTGVPVIFEVLATEDLDQAEARAGGSHGNKGWEAAETALEMADLLHAMPG
jgi:6,7-dimethyl-8-ribityllumazine synthase